MYRFVFMGTPEFALPSLQGLYLAEGGQGAPWQIVAVVTQPDRPGGRGKRLVAGPVKEFGLAHGLSVWQPESLRKDPQAVTTLADLAPDLIVVAAYGQILPPSVLEIPSFGCINVHASLLPAYRGASPVSAAILKGDEETGVTIMLMDAGMDTGPVLAQARQPIHPDDTTASLTRRLAEQGRDLLLQTLPRWLDGRLPPIRQEELPGTVSVCRPVPKSAGRIDWGLPAQQIERMTRAYTPWPGAYTTWRGEIFKIWQGEAVSEAVDAPVAVGAVLLTGRGPAVVTGHGILLLRTVQPAGRRAMAAPSFVNGAPDFVGSRLGP